MSAAEDDILAVLPTFIGRRCLFIERPAMSLADVISASVDGGMFRASFAAATDQQVTCDIDADYSFDNDLSMPYGPKWDVSLNLKDFDFDPEYWDGSRYMGWRVIFDPDVITRFSARDMSWMEEWFG